MGLRNLLDLAGGMVAWVVTSSLLNDLLPRDKPMPIYMQCFMGAVVILCLAGIFYYGDQ